MTGPGRWVVTGGAGYVGGHVVAALRDAGAEVTVLDDLSTGHADRVPAGVGLVRGQVADRTLLARVLPGADGVVHLAARTSAPESVADPLAYYRANVTDLLTLLEAMGTAGVPRLVASSSAAVYGTGGSGPAALPESAPTRPLSPYGRTKLIGEHLLADVGPALGVATVALRYFNVAGALTPVLADTKAGGLVTAALTALRADRVLTVHGHDHPTPDGTPVRDYVHPADVADAHVAAVHRLTGGWSGTAVYNVGTGHGTSVLELLRGLSTVTGHPLRTRFGPARAGDPAVAVADPAAITADLGWVARHDVLECLRSAWSCAPQRTGVTGVPGDPGDPAAEGQTGRAGTGRWVTPPAPSGSTRHARPAGRTVTASASSVPM